MVPRATMGGGCAGIAFLHVVLLLAPRSHGQPAEPETVDWIAAAAKHVQSIPDAAMRSQALYELAYVQARAGRLADAKASSIQVAESSHRNATLAFIARRELEAGNLDAARATVEEARRMALANLPDSASFGEWQLIRALVEVGRTDEARALVHALPSTFTPTIELTALAEQLSKQGQIDEALAVLRQMDQRYWPSSLKQIAAANVSPQAVAAWLAVAEQLRDPAHRDLAYENLAESFAEKGMFDLAEQMAAHIRSEAAQPRARGKIQSAWVKDRSANELADRLASSGGREEKLPLLQALIRSLAAEGRVEEAERAIEQMAATIRESPREPERSKFGRFDDAAALATIEANYLLTAGEWQKRGNDDAARQRIDRAKQAITALPAEAGITKILLTHMLTAAQIGVGDLAGARDVVQALDGPLRSAADRVAVAFVEAGDMASVMDVTKLLPRDSPGYGRSVGEIAAAMIKAGDVARAQELLKPLGASHDDAEAYRAAGSALVESGGAAELADWVREMPVEVHRAYACLGAADVGNKRLTPAP